MSLEIVKSVLDQARPLIESHGGSIDLVDYKDEVVYVRLSGACVGCPLSFITLKLGLESQLKEKIPQLKKVVAVTE